VERVAPDKTPSRIAGMFDAIAPRYDLLNHVLSAGMDRRWRDRAVDELQLAGGARVLDLCTGTADLAIATVTRVPGSSVVGVDFAGEMLRLANRKLGERRLASSVRLIRGDATRLPIASGSCDAATIGFGIRNVAEPERALAELARVVTPGGRLAILEFGFPRIPGIRTLYKLYFQQVLPRIGGAVSRHGDAYSYLPQSVGAFPSPEAFAAMMSRAGFGRVRAVPLTLGIVYLFVGIRD
jgi:demethylmenaquinone methyltransferase / 2-methoxy-6-polyprenyl-1,4-benzoquinol methylase